MDSVFLCVIFKIWDIVIDTFLELVCVFLFLLNDAVR